MCIPGSIIRTALLSRQALNSHGPDAARNPVCCVHMLCVVFAVAVFPKWFAGKRGRGRQRGDSHLGVPSQHRELKIAAAGEERRVCPLLAAL